MTASSTPFPDRDLILFLTFSVILVTLVGQGFMLPPIIRALGLTNAGRRERHADREEEFRARRQAIEAAISRIEQLIAEGRIPADFVRPLLALHRERLKHVEHRSDGDAHHRRLIEQHDEVEFLLIATERELINDLYRHGQLKDEARRRIERELDLRDAHLTNLRTED